MTIASENANRFATRRGTHGAESYCPRGCRHLDATRRDGARLAVVLRDHGDVDQALLVVLASVEAQSLAMGILDVTVLTTAAAS